jgi:NAD-dependent SIR2 family protein deacetylase
VAEIIDLDKRRQHSKGEEGAESWEEKMLVLRRVLHCSRCSLKCSRCSAQVPESDEKPQRRLPYPLCPGCQEEYEIYLKRRRGEETTGKYLHQRALDRYRSSKEFVKLLQEFESIC